jgi:hypothetical protein
MKLLEIIRKVLRRQRPADEPARAKHPPKPKQPPAGLIPVGEFAEQFGTDSIMVSRWVQMGCLRAVKVGEEWFVTEEEAERFLQRARAGRMTPAITRHVIAEPGPGVHVLAPPVREIPRR